MDISEKINTPQEQEEDDDYIAPIMSSYNEKIICSLFNCVDRLLVTQQCIQPPALPTIVLVGDKCSGKSSLVSSLIGIKIPRFCTRIPVLIKLQSHHSPKLEFSLEFDGKERTTSTDYNDVVLEITRATKEIAGTTSGISNKALTLILKKNGFPDLTIVDLPGIPTTLDNDEANNKETCEQIIMKYITPEDRIILNVLSGSSDSLPNKFESMNMCRKVDKKCERTLVVVTKADNAPHKFLNELVLDKVTAMGFNFVCVRNNIDAESFKESESAEATLFELVPPTIDKTLFGTRVLARKLMLMQAKITSIDITRKITDRLDANISDLKKLPNQRFSSVAYGLKAVMRLLSPAKKSLQEILLRGDQFDEDCSTGPRSIVEMLAQYSVQLHSKINLEKKEDFLMNEIMYIEERKVINGLPIDFLDEKVSGISKMAEEFVVKLWNYIEKVVIQNLMHHFDCYAQLQESTTRAVQNLIAKKKDDSVNWAREIVEMERLAAVYFTCNDPCYAASCNRLLAQGTTFMEIMNNSKILHLIINLEGVGEVDVAHLRNNHDLGVVRQAFDLKMKMTAYWKIFSTRQVDLMALRMMSTVQKMINNEMEESIVTYLMTPYDDCGVERILEELPETSKKRRMLKKSVKILEESKKEVEKISTTIYTQSFQLLFGNYQGGPMSDNPFMSSYISWFLSFK